MKNGAVRLNQLALAKMYSLLEADREQILRVVEFIADLPPEQWPPAKVKKLPTPEPLYVLGPTSGFYVFFQPTEDGGIEVLDVAQREIVDLFAEAKR